ncbi:hypothetical protein NVP1101O_119 [Vibrio phage 1.101.O._10N.261.45.C6]|nr:hypothetical protein NVP1101O_119 [Vibrio phage 1.101.O._10N.261.45.C6]
MALTTYAKNLVIDHLTDNTVLYVAAFDEDPSVGTELQSNGRQVLTFNTNSVDGSVTSEVTSALTIPAGNDVEFVGVFDDVSAGNLILSYEIPTPETFFNEGDFVVESVTISLT